MSRTTPKTAKPAQTRKTKKEVLMERGADRPHDRMGICSREDPEYRALLAAAIPEIGISAAKACALWEFARADDRLCLDVSRQHIHRLCDVVFRLVDKSDPDVETDTLLIGVVNLECSSMTRLVDGTVILWDDDEDESECKARIVGWVLKGQFFDIVTSVACEVLEGCIYGGNMPTAELEELGTKPATWRFYRWSEVYTGSEIDEPGLESDERAAAE